MTAKYYFLEPSKDSFHVGPHWCLEQTLLCSFISHLSDCFERYTKPSGCWSDWNLIFEGWLWGWAGMTSKCIASVKNSWCFGSGLGTSALSCQNWSHSREQCGLRYSGCTGKSILASGTAALFTALHLLLSLKKNKVLLSKYTTKIITRYVCALRKLNRSGMCVWIGCRSSLPNDGHVLAWTITQNNTFQPGNYHKRRLNSQIHHTSPSSWKMAFTSPTLRLRWIKEEFSFVLIASSLLWPFLE